MLNLKASRRHFSAGILPVLFAFLGQPQAKAVGVPPHTQIPFSFYVGQQQMPAGEYVLNRVFFGNVYSLKNVKNGQTVMVSLPPGIGNAPKHLIFKTDRNGRTLARVQ
jgi:hypothetical protein